MGSMSRNKGKRGEREVINLLQPIVEQVYAAHDQEPPILQRNTLQSDRGGTDIAGLDWLAPEVKFHKAVSLGPCWRQACGQAKPHQLPVLFYRNNSQPWRVMTRLPVVIGDRVVTQVVVLDMIEFLIYFRVRLQYELSKRG